jgi:cytochrome P450
VQASVPLAPIPPAKPLTAWSAIAVARRNILAVIPQAAFEAPVFDQSSFLWGASFLVSHPDGVRQVLVDRVANYPKSEMSNRVFAAAFGDGILTSQGETWRAHRRLMAPAFEPRSVEGYAPMMAETARACAARWRAGEAFDIAEAMADLSLQIISRAIFSGAGGELGPLMDRTLREWDALLGAFGFADFVPGLRDARARARLTRITAAFSDVDAAMRRLILERRGPPAGGDLLDRLIGAHDPETGLGLDDDEIRDQLVTLYVAGHETTAVAMTWTWWLISQHPQIEARLHAELDASPDAPPAYARQVVEEAMRLFPPVPRIPPRQAVNADEICGVRIPAGAQVCVAPWVVHRHRALWQDPERFDPDRFAGARPPRFTYLPFGAGPRICIGATLALTEATLILCEIARHWRLLAVPDQIIGMRPRMTLRSAGPILMVPEPR